MAEAELDQLLHGKSRQDVSAKMARALQDNALMTSCNGHADDDDVFLVEIEKSERGLGLGLIDGLVSRQFFSPPYTNIASNFGESILNYTCF